MKDLELNLGAAELARLRAFARECVEGLAIEGAVVRVPNSGEAPVETGYPTDRARECRLPPAFPGHNAELRSSSLGVLGEMVRRRDLSVRELASEYLAACDEGASLNAFSKIEHDYALRQADVLDAELRLGFVRSALHGLPFSVKDVIDVIGFKTCAGSRLLEDRPVETDAAITSALRNAGAVIIGKTTTFEFALGRPCLGDVSPPALNVWNQNRATSGSSSGSACAVAAGLSVASVGTDTGGSVRCPAAYAGVVGLKPTRGLISTTGTIPLSPTLDHIGLMARTADDLEFVLAAVTNGCTSGSPVPQSSMPKRIGVPWSFIKSRDQLDREVLVAFAAAVKDLDQLGVQVVDVELPPLESADAIWSIIMLAEAAHFHRKWLTSRIDEYGQGVRETLPAGLWFTADEYRAALDAQRLLLRQLTSVIDQVDLLATPTMARQPGLLAGDDQEAHRHPSTSFTEIFNIVGFPSATVPCGFSTDQMPIGMQIVGRPFHDFEVLEMCRLYSAAR